MSPTPPRACVCWRCAATATCCTLPVYTYYVRTAHTLDTLTLPFSCLVCISVVMTISTGCFVPFVVFAYLLPSLPPSLPRCAEWNGRWRRTCGQPWRRARRRCTPCSPTSRGTRSRTTRSVQFTSFTPLYFASPHFFRQLVSSRLV